jgi:exonuclease SbcC
LIALKPEARRWAELGSERRTLEQEEAEGHRLLTDAAAIRRDAGRLAALRAELPRLKDLLAARQALTQRRDAARALIGEAEQAREAFETATTAHAEAQASWNALRDEDRSWLDEENAAGLEVQALAPAMEELRQREKHEAEVKRYEAELAAYPENLDAERARLQREVEALERLQAALPWIEQFTRARTAWREARSGAATACQEKQASEEALTRLRHEREAAAERSRCAAEEARRRSDTLSQAQAMLDEVAKRIERFDETKDAPQCLFCGQELRPEHRADHERLLAEEQWSALDRRDRARKAHDQAVADQEARDQDLEETKQREEAGTESVREAEARRVEWQRKAEAAVQAAAEALAPLPRLYTDALRPSPNARVEECLAEDRLPAEEMDTLRGAVKELASLKEEARQAETRAREHDNQRMLLNAARAHRDAPREHLPERSPEEVRAAHTAAEARQKRAHDGRAALQQPLETARQATAGAERMLEQSRQAKEEAEARLDPARQAETEAFRAVSACEAALSEAWRAEAMDLSAGRIKEWEREAGSLTGADERLSRLQQAETSAAQRHSRLEGIAREMAAIPQAAQRPLAGIESEEQEARATEQNHGSVRQAAHDERQKLETRRDRRAECEERRREAAREVALCQRLARLLDDREGLQRWLLRQAVRGVVSGANEVLDRISAGALRIDLKEDGDALDLIARKNGEAVDPFDVEFLSGSERFRIACSLALSIGRHASRSGQRVPCVMIDEGFGCLDEEGRHDMIDALHDLKEDLQRVIVVSHQREFYDRFPDRYVIEKVDNGASRIRLAERD